MQIRVWQRLSPAERSAVLARPALGDDATLAPQVAAIVAKVRADGDALGENRLHRFQVRAPVARLVRPG
jgi:hypothetical protein